MPTDTIQVNMRLVPEHADLVRRTAARLKGEAGFAGRLEALLSSASGGAEVPAGLLEMVNDLRQRVEALEARPLIARASDAPTVAAPTDSAPKANASEGKTKKPAAGRSEQDRAEWKAFAARVKGAPTFEGRTQTAVAAEIAEKTGLSKNTIANVLAGCIPSSAETRGKILGAVGLGA